MLGELQRSLINAYPSWFTILVIMLFLINFVVLVFHFIEKYFPSIAHEDNEIFVTAASRVTSINYAFLLGFTITVLWQHFNKAELDVTKEAGYLSLILSDAQGLSKEARVQVHSAVKNYVSIVVNEEWRAMGKGYTLEKADRALEALLLTMQKITPQSEKEGFFYGDILNNLHKVFEKRRLRSAAVASVLSDAMRILLLFGYVIMALLLAMVKSRKRYEQEIITLLVCVIISFNIAMAVNLDHPFSGNVSIKSDPFKTGTLATLKI